MNGCEIFSSAFSELIELILCAIYESDIVSEYIIFNDILLIAYFGLPTYYKFLEGRNNVSMLFYLPNYNQSVIHEVMISCKKRKL